jgi:CDP-glucose 4,6-dehydratase
MESLVKALDFYQGRRVFITGHTGFKGSWLSKMLLNLGAELTGYALNPVTEQNLFTLLNLETKMHSVIHDIRNLTALQSAMNDAQPEVVFHLAAQPIVLESYKNPVYTYETNVMGTVNLLEAVRNCSSVKSVVIITTDKVYKNNEWSWGYREVDELGGFDPYSNSKSCCELVVSSYKNSFFKNTIPVSTVRAGNVIGGGDFAPDRIIPDCVRSVLQNKPIFVRNPYSVRPYQHVIEPLFAYLKIAQQQFYNKDLQGCYNIGPNVSDCVCTEEIVKLFCEHWGNNARWETNKAAVNSPLHEANFLKLDVSRIKELFGIAPKWNIKKAVEKTIDFVKCCEDNKDVNMEIDKQINEYIRG